MIGRRQFIRRTGAAVSALIITPVASAMQSKEQEAMETDIDMICQPPGKAVVTGQGVGDFDFLMGDWTIRHARLKDGTKDEWVRFDSSAVVYRVMNGMGSIEELRKADGSDMGMGIRVWLSEQRKWADHWTSAANGVVNPPQLGEFIDGEGVFVSEEMQGDVKWLYRGVWDKITPVSCRWHQSASRDGGKNWEWNWWMEWRRVE